MRIVSVVFVSSESSVRRRLSLVRPYLLPGLAVLLCLAALPLQAPQVHTGSFAQTVASLSERGGYFDTDNLISNESSYLQVVPELKRRNVRGGAYVGVGPDQNFTYIAETRPAIAFIVDIRRDNVLLHLLFKALFQVSRTRIEYVAHLFGRPLPANDGAWRGASVDRLVKYIDEQKGTADAALRKRLDEAIHGFGIPLTAEDVKTITDFHERFMSAGLSLQFQSAGRPPRGYYPTYRELLLDKDAAGRQSNFLASEDAFAFVKDLEARDLVIPVVGDLAGPSALLNIGKLLRSRGARLSAFYASNVEFYLFRDGSFPRFVANLRQIPLQPNAVIIRSIFQRYAFDPRRPGDDSVSQLQEIGALLSAESAGKTQTYADMLAVGRR
jgi:hypothetical protein